MEQITRENNKNPKAKSIQNSGQEMDLGKPDRVLGNQTHLHQVVKLTLLLLESFKLSELLL